MLGSILQELPAPEVPGMWGFCLDPGSASNMSVKLLDRSGYLLLVSSLLCPGCWLWAFGAKDLVRCRLLCTRQSEL